MLRSVLLKSLRDQRRALLWWGIGLILLAVSLMAFYPSFADASEFDNIVEGMPEALSKIFFGEFTELTSPEGYLNTQLFLLALPLLFMVYTIARGSDAIAGEEERGTLDLLLSYPIARRRVAAEMFGAMMIATIIMASILWLTLAICTIAIGMDISIWLLAQATLSSWLLGLSFGALALALGCATGKRGFSIGISTAVGTVTYFLNALAPLVEALEPLQHLSPFYYAIAADPLTNGMNPMHITVLIGLTCALLATAILAFNRRDLAM